MQARSVRGESWAEARTEVRFAVDVCLRTVGPRGPLRNVSDVFTKDRVGEYANMKLTVRVKGAASVGRIINKLWVVLNMFII